MTTEITDPLAEALWRSEGAYRKAARVSEEIRLDRNELVKQALEAGWSLGKVSKHTGLSRTRIQQIKNGAK